MIRAATAADAAAIRGIHLASFPTAAEADLVQWLHDDGDVILSLVAEEGGVVIGHALFSRMTAPFRALGLAPVAVLPDHRRTGVAARLIEAGLARAAASGWQGVFVLGDAAYYGRFGFSAAAASGFANPWAGPHFLLKALSPLKGTAARVDYAPAFARLA